MNHLNLQVRISKIEAQIALADSTIQTIVKAANVELPEHLTGASLEAWQAEFKVSQDLYQYLQRINSVLDTAEKYVFANCD